MSYKSNKMKRYLPLLAVMIMGCSRAPEFSTFPKVDAHVHLETSDDSFVEIIQENNMKMFTLVTRSVPQAEIDTEFKYARDLHVKHPDAIGFATTFTMDGFGEPGWEEKTINWLRKSFDEGAIALKLWKDIGMTFRDADSSFAAYVNAMTQTDFRVCGDIAISEPDDTHTWPVSETDK